MRATAAPPEMVVTNIYRELLKRLDDSSDDIRLDACQTLAVFMRIVPADYDRNHYKYLLRGLLVHLDDTNPSIQVSFGFLCLLVCGGDPFVPRVFLIDSSLPRSFPNVFTGGRLFRAERLPLL
jgi:hypothetical protein